MATRYAKTTFAYWDTTKNQHETVCKGATRDSVTDDAAVQYPGEFQTTPLVAGPDITGVLAQYLITYPKGP
jgi:hypothetical protein